MTYEQTDKKKKTYAPLFSKIQITFDIWNTYLPFPGNFLLLLKYESVTYVRVCWGVCVCLPGEVMEGCGKVCLGGSNKGKGSECIRSSWLLFVSPWNVAGNTVDMSYPAHLVHGAPATNYLVLRLLPWIVCLAVPVPPVFSSVQCRRWRGKAREIRQHIRTDERLLEYTYLQGEIITLTGEVASKHLSIDHWS